MKKPYNGHESRTAWNVSLWINNDESIYRRAVELMKINPKSAARRLKAELPERTDDGYKYSVHTVRLAIRDILK
jgi:hypothetical protein